MSALSVLKLVDLICHLWQQYVSTALIPLASTSVTVRRELVVYNNQTVARIEQAANSLLQKLTDGELFHLLRCLAPNFLATAIVAWLSSHLSKQKKNDFKPRNDEQSFERLNTEPCVACCDTLERVRDAAKENLSGKNLEVFLTEIGVSFHAYVLLFVLNFAFHINVG